MKISYQMTGFIYLFFMWNSITIHDFLLFYAGISFLAVFVWLYIFFYTKRRNYLILIIATASGAVYYLNAYGVVLDYPKAYLVFLAVVTLTFYVLASELNAFKKSLSHSTYYTLILVRVVTFIFQVLSPLFLPWQTAVTISLLLSVAGTISVSSVFVYLWLAQHKTAARFSFLVYLPDMTGFIIFAFAEIKILPAELKIIGPLSSIIFMLLIFFGMVTYVSALRKKREIEQLEKQELIHRQKNLLEQKVEERTRELEMERKRSEELLIHASQKQMAELKLQSLRTQLNPHFMFNSINAIGELILKEDFENSHTYLARFARLFRMVMENAEKPFVPLHKEIDFLELYLSVEKLLMPDLTFSITTDPSINQNETLIPNMILQPYIENALWHGLSHKPSDRKLELIIQKQNGFVMYDVKDNGIGRKKSAELKNLYRKKHKSRGGELLAKRFKLFREEFGSDITTQVTDVMKNGVVRGTKVSILVPDSLSQHIKNDLL